MAEVLSSNLSGPIHFFFRFLSATGRFFHKVFSESFLVEKLHFTNHRAIWISPDREKACGWSKNCFAILLLFLVLMNQS